MRKVFYISFITLLICTSATTKKNEVPETYNISTMEKLTDCSFNIFKLTVQLSGYSLKEKFSNNELKHFESDIKRANGRPDQITRTEKSPTSILIGFYTTDKAYHTGFQDSLKAHNYKPVKVEKVKLSSDITANWHYYSNKEYTTIIYNYNLDGIEWYCHQIFKGAM